MSGERYQRLKTMDYINRQLTLTQESIYASYCETVREPVSIDEYYLNFDRKKFLNNELHWPRPDQIGDDTSMFLSRQYYGGDMFEFARMNFRNFNVFGDSSSGFCMCDFYVPSLAYESTGILQSLNYIISYSEVYAFGEVTHEKHLYLRKVAAVLEAQINPTTGLTKNFTMDEIVFFMRFCEMTLADSAMTAAYIGPMFF
jgi:hypothetical protein